MTLQPSSVSSVPLASHPLLRVVLLAALAIAVVLVVTAAVGVAVAGPAFEVTPDPAGLTLPF